jgi:hypothetical protein
MNALPDDLQQQVLEFVESLRQQRPAKTNNAWDVLESLTGTVEAPSRLVSRARSLPLRHPQTSGSRFMSRERLFLDTAFIQALLNPRDDYHQQAKQLFPRVRVASEIWITEAILVEVGNALSTLNRNGAVQFIQQCYRTDNINVVSVDTALLMQATRSLSISC